MKSDWETITLDNLSNDLVTVKSKHADGELTQWAGQVWHVKTEVPIRGNHYFNIMPARSNRIRDKIMVLPLRNPNPNSPRDTSSGELYRTDEVNVPYGVVLTELQKIVAEKVNE